MLKHRRNQGHLQSETREAVNAPDLGSTAGSSNGEFAEWVGQGDLEDDALESEPWWAQSVEAETSTETVIDDPAPEVDGDQALTEVIPDHGGDGDGGAEDDETGGAGDSGGGGAPGGDPVEPPPADPGGGGAPAPLDPGGDGGSTAEPPPIPVGAAVAMASVGVTFRPAAFEPPAVASMRVASAAILTRFLTDNALQVEALAVRGEEVGAQIDASVQIAASAIDAAIAAQVSLVRQEIGNARATTEEQAQGLRTHIAAEQEGAKVNLSANVEAARQEVATAFDAAVVVVNEKAMVHRGKVEGSYATSAEVIRGMGPEFGEKATALGSRRAKGYRDQKNGESNWQDGPIHDNRMEASAKAAEQVGKQYSEGLSKEGEGQATALLEGRTRDHELGDSISTQLEGMLDEQRTTATDTLTDSEVEGHKAVDQTSTALTGSVDARAEGCLAELATYEATLPQQVEDYGARQRDALVGQATDARVAMTQGIAEAVTTLTEVLGLVQASFNGHEAPDPLTLSADLATAQAELDAQLILAHEQVNTGLASALEAIGDGESTTVGRIEELADTSTTHAQGLGERFEEWASQLFEGTTKTLGTVVEEHRKSVEAVRDNAKTGLLDAASGAEAVFGEVHGQLDSQLDASQGALREGLQGALDKEDSDITEHAKQAAAQVQPRWKTVLKVVLVIAVLVVVALVAGPLVIGAVGSLATALGASAAASSVIAAVVGGAIVGAGAGAVIQMGNNLIDGKSLFDGVVKAMIVGAIGGAFGGAGAAYATGFSSAAARFFIELGIDGIGGVVGDLVVGNPITLQSILIGMGIGVAMGQAVRVAGILRPKVKADADVDPNVRPEVDPPAVRPEGEVPTNTRHIDEPSARTDDVDATTGRAMADGPRMEVEAHTIQGRTETVRFRDLSGRAQGLVRKLETDGAIRIDSIEPDDLIAISKFLNREVAVVQHVDSQQMRVVVGTGRTIPASVVKPGEVYISHTHPTYTSTRDHFTTDLANTQGQKHMESVIDWNGTEVYYRDGQILNPRHSDGSYAPMPEGFRAPWKGDDGSIIGHSRFRNGMPDHKGHPGSRASEEAVLVNGKAIPKDAVDDLSASGMRDTRDSPLDADDFPTPELAFKGDPARMDAGRIRGFADTQAQGTQKALDQMNARLDEGTDPVDAVRLLEQDLRDWRYGLQAGKEGSHKLKDPIPANDPNRDPFGDAAYWGADMTRDRGQRRVIGELIEKRFAHHSGDGTTDVLLPPVGDKPATTFKAPAGDVIQNRVQLPDGRLVDGNKLLRGDAVEGIRQFRADNGKSSYNYWDPKQRYIAETGAPKARAEIHEAGVEELGRLIRMSDSMADNPSAILEAKHDFANAAYLLFQSPMINRGTDATTRMMLVATYKRIFRHAPKLPQDIDIQAYARSQDDFIAWLLRNIEADVPRPRSSPGSRAITNGEPGLRAALGDDVVDAMSTPVKNALMSLDDAAVAALKGSDATRLARIGEMIHAGHTVEVVSDKLIRVAGNDIKLVDLDRMAEVRFRHFMDGGEVPVPTRRRLGGPVKKKVGEHYEAQKAKVAVRAHRQVKIVMFEVPPQTHPDWPKYRASQASAEQKIKAFEQMGLEPELVILDRDIGQGDFERQLDAFNASDDVVGVIVQLPTPGPLKGSVGRIAPTKDLDALSADPARPHAYPATSEGVVRMAMPFLNAGDTVAVVGGKGFVGEGVVKMLEAQGFNVKIFDQGDDLRGLLQCDVVLSAVGKQVIEPQHLKILHKIVVDTGFVPVNIVDGKLQVTSDISPDAVGISENITPVPGGTGPVEMAVLMERMAKMLGIDNSTWRASVNDEGKLEVTFDP
ncbi:MAG: tetrahydrofolate dehydrogenase/cyclohydrolase catalytic domain-containing protein [Myxococcota bacterium]